MEILAEKPADVPRAYSLYYSKMADHFARLIRTSHPRTLLEAGCGRGQLTIPLLRRLPNTTLLMGVDSSRGPYSGWLDELELRISSLGLTNRVRLIRSDARRMSAVRSSSMDAVVSNELLCDLSQRRQLETALEEFYRVLGPGGLMVHGEWASFREKSSESIVVKHWPSWNPDQLFSATRTTGFHDFHITYFDTTIKFGFEAASEELRNWGASTSTIKRNAKLLRRHGISLPFEHIIQCRK